MKLPYTGIEAAPNIWLWELGGKGVSEIHMGELIAASYTPKDFDINVKLICQRVKQYFAVSMMLLPTVGTGLAILGQVSPQDTG